MIYAHLYQLECVFGFSYVSNSRVFIPMFNLHLQNNVIALPYGVHGHAIFNTYHKNYMIPEFFLVAYRAQGASAGKSTHQIHQNCGTRKRL